MAKYDRNLIVAVLADTDDPLLQAQSTALKVKSEVSAIPVELASVRFRPQTGLFDDADVTQLRRVMMDATTESRVYLLGHGDWQHRSIGGASPHKVAALFAAAGLPDIKMLSIVGDSLGRDSPTIDTDQLSGTGDSFAAQLHRSLKQDYNISTTVQARVFRTIVSGDPATLGQKRTANAQDEFESPGAGHHREQSKLRFFWKDGAQKREWAY